MTDKTHQLIGLTAATFAFLVLHPDTLVSLPIAISVTIGAVVGSVAPDIDQPTSSLWNRIPLGGIWGRIVSECLGGHRNLSHSILGVYLFSLAINWISSTLPPAWLIEPRLFTQSALIGFIAHLVADSITVMGIPLLWPLGKNMGFTPRPFHGIRIVTGKWFENLVVFPLIIITFIGIIFIYKHQFCALFPFVCP
jgi:membrane-bound metal-dependent hydrolase YbcI (DUF457 family)